MFNGRFSGSQGVSLKWFRVSFRRARGSLRWSQGVSEVFQEVSGGILVGFRFMEVLEAFRGLSKGVSRGHREIQKVSGEFQ